MKSMLRAIPCRTLCQGCGDAYDYEAQALPVMTGRAPKIQAGDKSCGRSLACDKVKLSTATSGINLSREQTPDAVKAHHEVLLERAARPATATWERLKQCQKSKVKRSTVHSAIQLTHVNQERPTSKPAPPVAEQLPKSLPPIQPSLGATTAFQGWPLCI